MPHSYACIQCLSWCNVCCLGMRESQAADELTVIAGHSLYVSHVVIIRLQSVTVPAVPLLGMHYGAQVLLGVWTCMAAVHCSAR
jgi:hypothetical protein